MEGRGTGVVYACKFGFIKLVYRWALEKSSHISIRSESIVTTNGVIPLYPPQRAQQNPTPETPPPPSSPPLSLHSQTPSPHS